ncbi:MAG: AmmeMemoRadiSam system radical SAM enzyme [Candidatus Brocadiia bacterium]
MRRRELLKAAAAGLATCPLAASCSAEAGEPAALSDHEALAWEPMDGARVHCMLCPRECIVPDGGRGACGVRENRGGTYRSLVYARAAAAHVDPIEKKPLFHVLPGGRAFSIATAGCNVECQFCQNWRLSQSLPEDLHTQYLPPDKVVEGARKHDCEAVAFTYNEPTVFYEYTLDTARAAREAGVHAVTISNGFIQADPMKRLCEYLSAVKVDLKAFTEDFYRRYVRGGRLKPVLETIKRVHGLAKHLELVILLIPGLNDSEDEIREMSRWVANEVGPDVPMHFSRCHPAYKMTNLARTPERTVVRAREIAVEEGIHYAYVGNLPGHEYESTFCHSCGEKIISRYAFHVEKLAIKDGECAHCGAAIPGVWG